MVSEAFASPAAPSPTDPTEPASGLKAIPAATTIRYHVWSFFRATFGLLTILVLLSLCSVIPFAQFFCLGYLVEVTRRAGTPGQRRQGLPGVSSFARFGSMLIVWCAFLAPVLLLMHANSVGLLVSPHVMLYRMLRFVLPVLLLILIVHLAVATWSAAPSLWLRPRATFRIALTLAHTTIVAWRESVPALLASLLRHLAPLGQLFLLGVRGYVAAAVWLLIPTALMYVGPVNPWCAWIGGILLGFVAYWLPMALARFALEDRIAAAFEVRALYIGMRRVPARAALAVIATTVLSIPLTTLKLEPGPWEIYVVFTLANLLLLVPLRWLWGWIYAAAAIQRPPASRIWTALCFAAALPFAALLAVVIFYSQYYSWLGAKALLSQQSYLLPVAF